MRKFLLLFFLIGGCDECEPLEVRCIGNSVKICNDEARWDTVTNCDTVEPKNLDWTCCYSKYLGEVTCLPKDACDGGTK